MAHFDNSEANIYNPDPTATVRWGEQTWEEMMMGGLFLSWANEDVEPPQVEEAVLTDAELAPMKAMIAAQDKNGDNMLQKDEVPEGMQQFFGMVDTDANGAVDATELYVAMKARGQ